MLKDIISILNGKILNLPKDFDLKINSFKLDSRDITLNDCFIAVNSGYLYIEDAINNGAMLIVTDKDIHIKCDVCIIKTDIKDALLKLISYVKDKYAYIPLIAITGSVGKTTTKELVASILSTKYNVLKSMGSKNNYIGIAETIFKLDDSYDFIVLEVGMNHLKEIHDISLAVKPDLCIITNIYSSHIGNLGSMKNILKAKLEILDGNSKAILLTGKKVKYPYLDKLKNIKIRNVKVTDVLSFKLIIDKFKYHIKFNIPNKGYINNIKLSLGLINYYKLNIEDVIKVLESFKPCKGRMDIIKCDNYEIIDDTYNASYESLKSSLKYLKKKKYKLVILGDIKELGTFSIKIHKKINKLLKGIPLDNILLVGEYMHYVKGRHFSSNEDIISYLKTKNLFLYTILVKGSRLMHLEDIVNYLKK